MTALVVDDDPEIAGYLQALLDRDGIDVELAADGESGGAALRSKDFDLLFLDLDLPGVKGDFLLRLLQKGKLRRPGAIALMSGAPELAAIHQSDWAEIATPMPKPFSSSDVRAFVHRALARRFTTGRGNPVLLVGAGIWAEALGRVLIEREGSVVVADTAPRALETFRRVAPAVVVIGPPFGPAGMIELCSAIRALAWSPRPSILAAVDFMEKSLATDLLTVGADRVLPVQRIWKLSDEAMRFSGLPRRNHRRVPLAAPVLVRHGLNRRAVSAFDLGEGGMGIERPGLLPDDSLHLSFLLPGQSEPIHADSEIAWRNHEETRIGLRFTLVASEDLTRIRDFVGGQEMSIG